MSQLRKAFTAAILAIVYLLGSPASASQTLSFNQVSYYQDGALAVANSAWGEFNIAYDQGIGVQWVNVVANPGTANAHWIVQNHPLLPASITGTSQYTSTSYFDLGVANGIPVSALDVGYLVTSAPMKFAPTLFDATALFSVGTSQNIINNGVPSGNMTLDAPGDGDVDWDDETSGLTVVWHEGMPNLVQENNWCGPGSAANSLHWLDSQNGFDITQTLIETQKELAKNFGNNNDGNWDKEQVAGLNKYVADHHLPLEVHYAGGVTLPQDTPLTWEWIEEEMKKGQDVQFMTEAHWVVVEGLISINGVHLFSYRDDPYQHGAATTDAEKDVINGRHVWSYFVDGHTSINGDTVLTAVAESPIPEPSTWMSFLLGFAGLGYALRRRQRTFQRFAAG